MRSRDKGKRGELEWAEYLRARGWNARRGQQFSGSPDSPDVVSDLDAIHWEVKRVERLNIDDAMEQACSDSPEHRIPVVAHRRNRGTWLCTLTAEDLLELLAEWSERKQNGRH